MMKSGVDFRHRASNVIVSQKSTPTSSHFLRPLSGTELHLPRMVRLDN